MPEPIHYSQPNLCQLDEPEALSLPPSAAALPAPAVSVDPPPLAPAVQQLVAAHASTQPDSCQAEGVGLALAASKTAISLVKVVTSAPSEVGLVYTVARFMLDAANLGAATAKFVDCEMGRGAKSSSP